MVIPSVPLEREYPGVMDETSSMDWRSMTLIPDAVPMYPNPLKTRTEVVLAWASRSTTFMLLRSNSPVLVLTGIDVTVELTVAESKIPPVYCGM